MRVLFFYSKTGEEWTYGCTMDQIPRVGDKVFLHPLKWVESVPRTVEEVIWFAKEEDDPQISVKIKVS